MDTVAFWVGTVLVPLIGVAISIYVARIYGDRAGTQAAIEYEKEKAKEARIIAIRALLNEVEIARTLARHNSETTVTGAIFAPFLKLPTNSFEVAFLSSQSNILRAPRYGQNSSRGLLSAVKAYLRHAHSVNVLIDAYLQMSGDMANAGHRHQVVKQVKAEVAILPNILNTIESSLEQLLCAEAGQQQAGL